MGMHVRCVGGWQDILEAYEVLGHPIKHPTHIRVEQVSWRGVRVIRKGNKVLLSARWT